VPRTGAATGTHTGGETRHDDSPDGTTSTGGPTTGTAADRPDSAAESADKQGEASRGR